MDEAPVILFGNFTAEETDLFFAREQWKSRGIEFPDDLPPFQQCFLEARVVPEESDDVVLENEVVAETQTAIATDENNVYDNETSEDNDIGQVTKSEEVVAIQNDISEPVCEDDQQVLEAEEEEPTTTPEEPKPNNVVTVGTKTMMTNTTSIRSGQHQPGISSWADLFKTKSSCKPQEPLVTNPPQLPAKDQEVDVGKGVDQFRQYFMDVLKKLEITYQTPHLQPRGLKNNANWCYINATLQVLLYCPSFYNFLMEFKLKTSRGKSTTPILDALVTFASQFTKMPQKQLNKNQDWNKHEVVMGMPFEPTYVYDLLGQITTLLSQQGKQEDAEEFLSCILDGLHEELVNLAGDGSEKGAMVTNHVENGTKITTNDEWEQVGPRNKSTITRKSMMEKSPIASIFVGYLRSSLVQHGVKESASIQPFYSIQLDLRGDVTTVQQAFDHFFSVEEIEGFQCDKSKVEVEVSKKWTLDSLPIVLVLHLKRFVVNKNGCEKLTKKVTYESELHIPPDTVSKLLKIRNKNMLSYKLFAVTYHHGKNLHGGHYTSDIYHPVVGWLRADDIHIKTIPTKFVFNPLSNRDPYLLYYRRGDISV